MRKPQFTLNTLTLADHPDTAIALWPIRPQEQTQQKLIIHFPSLQDSTPKALMMVEHPENAAYAFDAPENPHAFLQRHCDRLTCSGLYFNFFDGQAAISPAEQVALAQALIDHVVAELAIRHCDIVLYGHDTGAALAIRTAFACQAAGNRLFGFYDRSAAKYQAQKQQSLLSSFFSAPITFSPWLDYPCLQEGTLINSRHDAQVTIDKSLLSITQMIVGAELGSLSRNMRANCQQKKGAKLTNAFYSKWGTLKLEVDNACTKLGRHHLFNSEEKNTHKSSCQALTNDVGVSADTAFNRYVRDCFLQHQQPIKPPVEAQTTLHLAILKQASADNISELIRQEPLALLLQDSNGNTPLHLMCQHARDLLVPTYQSLSSEQINLLQQALVIKNNIGLPALLTSAYSDHLLATLLQQQELDENAVQFYASCYTTLITHELSYHCTTEVTKVLLNEDVNSEVATNCRELLKLMSLACKEILLNNLPVMHYLIEQLSVPGPLADNRLKAAILTAINETPLLRKALMLRSRPTDLDTPQLADEFCVDACVGLYRVSGQFLNLQLLCTQAWVAKKEVKDQGTSEPSTLKAT